MIILLSKFRVTKISVSYITGENHIGSSFIRQKYFCLPTEIAVLPTEAWNIIPGGCHPTPTPPRNSGPGYPVVLALSTIKPFICTKLYLKYHITYVG
jgi:hypothetical protein